MTSLPREFIFNGDNKQTEVKRDGVTIGRYFYDGEGKRVKKETDTETTVFVYSAGKLVAEYSTQLSQSPSVAYTTTDHLGTPRVITDQFGQVKARRDFMPFGEELYTGVGGRTGDTGLKYSSNQDNIRQKFTGYQKDTETGLDFAEARMYENRLGRFTAVDPLLASGKSANPQTFNRFIYVGNNPVMITDPSGLDWYRQAIKDTDRFSYKWSDKDPGGDWTAVDFGDNVFLPINEWVTGDGQAMGTVYLDRYRNSVLTQEQFSTMAASAIPGGACYANPQCAGLRNPLRDNQSVFEAQRFSTGVPIGVRNQAKSWVDVPNWNFAPPVVNWFVTDSLNTRFGVQPFFNYETPRSGSESVGAFVGARTVDLVVARGTFSVGTAVGNFARNPFALRGGWGPFGERGISLGRYRFDVLYENPKAKGGTFFSVRQPGVQGGNFFRIDRGILHSTGDVKTHIQFRWKIGGQTFGSTKQQRAWYPPFRIL